LVPDRAVAETVAYRKDVDVMFVRVAVYRSRDEIDLLLPITEAQAQ